MILKLKTSAYYFVQFRPRRRNDAIITFQLFKKEKARDF